jgi:transcription initiation factor IIE alpha subunit
MWKNMTDEQKIPYKQMSSSAPMTDVKKRKVPKIPPESTLQIIDLLQKAGPDANSDEVAQKLGLSKHKVRAIKGNLLNGLYANLKIQ